MNELRVVRASGDGLARGLQIGSELRDLIVFSMIADVEHGRMWVAPGIPCEQEYQEIDLPELR